MAQEKTTPPPPDPLKFPSQPTVAPTNKINDMQFTSNLQRLKNLRTFFLKEAIQTGPEDSTCLSLGSLNTLQYGDTGREPTADEWESMESHTQTLFRLLNEPLRKRFILSDIPAWVSLLPIVLALVALASLIVCVHSPRPLVILASYLVWLLSLGAIGSVAFVGMNALSVQQDATFDLSNLKLMVLRITLGALFGLVLTLPFGFEGFVKFIFDLQNGRTGSGLNSQEVMRQAMLLLLPFVLGFSTSVVIVILNRLVDSVQAFFGRAESPKAESARPSR